MGLIKTRGKVKSELRKESTIIFYVEIIMEYLLYY